LTRLLLAQAGAYAVPLHERLMGVVGLLVMIAIAYAMSDNRKAISWRLVWMAMLLQAVFAVIVLKTTAGLIFFEKVGDVVDSLLNFTEEGARFVFGNLVRSTVPVGASRPDGTLDTGAGFVAQTGAFFAFNVLPTIIFLASLMAVLYHLRVMQPIVKGIAWIMQRTLKTSGAETLSASANIFLGQTEAPLVVKPYIATMTSSELFNTMVCGFATASGGVLAAYTLMLRDIVPNVAGHLLAATILQTPAAILLSKIMVPETGEPVTKGTMQLEMEQTSGNVIEAAANGASEGVSLALNVAGMLMAFIAPPWGDALTPGSGLDLRRTSPPVAEVVDKLVQQFPKHQLLCAIQTYATVNASSLTELASRFDWSARKTYDLNEAGENHGVLLGARGWIPPNPSASGLTP